MFRRQQPKVGAECPNWARSDLCGGRSVMGVPTAIKLQVTVGSIPPIVPPLGLDESALYGTPLLTSLKRRRTSLGYAQARSSYGLAFSFCSQDDSPPGKLSCGGGFGMSTRANR